MERQPISFIAYDQHMVTIGSYEDALEVLDDLQELAEEIAPSYPLLLLVNIK